MANAEYIRPIFAKGKHVPTPPGNIGPTGAATRTSTLGIVMNAPQDPSTEQSEQAPELLVPARAVSEPVAVVGIGASAGGLQAYTRLLDALPADTGMAFVLVQHMAAKHESLLPEILSRSTTMPVTEVGDRQSIEPNHVYVIPPDRDLLMRDGALSLQPRAPGSHHPIDLFLTALSDSHGHRAIGVVLSGTATDGTLGLQAIKAAGGITFAQDETAIHNGMPRSAIASGCVDFVLPPESIASEIARLAREPYVATTDTVPPLNEVAPIIEHVRAAIGVDFVQYKGATLQRRIARRMALQKIPTLLAYKEYLQQHAEEAKALYEDILISVTTFFRNPEAYEALRSKVFPKLFADRFKDDAVRVWVLGCSTGEEAYSLAISLTEYADEHAHPATITLYATDLNDTAVQHARRGWYPRGIINDVSPERLRRYFHEADGGYSVNKSIRELCIFAHHNALTNPPFSRMDLVSCRNVLIYMESDLQRRLLALMHYALKPSGFLLLGPSETISQQREAFDVVDAKHKLFAKRLVSRRLDTGLPIAPANRAQRGRGAVHIAATRDPHTDITREAERALLNRYAPAGVLINADADILQFRGDTGLYLTPAPGKASLNLFKMARDGLLVSLRAALLQAKKEDSPATQKRVRFRSGDADHDVNLSVVPVHSPAARERCYWVLFEDMVRSAARPALKGKRGRSNSAAARGQEEQDQIGRMTQELKATREYLQSVIEQHELSNEELQSANEEVQSTNEELQSINEELETSKEEIQSTNEELTTVNDELRTRNDELFRANDDLTNLFSSVQMALVMVWRDLRIHRFTPPAEQLLNIIPADVGRPISDIKLNVNLSDLPRLLTEVMDSATPKELEVQDRQQRWHLLRIRPYRTRDNKVDGAVIALLDIDSIKRSLELQSRQALMLDQAHEAIFAWEPDGRIVYWNSGAEALYGYPARDAIGRNAQQLLLLERDQAAFDVLARTGHWSGELRHQTRDGRQIVIESIQGVIQEAGRRLVLETDRDITQRKELEENLRKRVEELAIADRHKNEFLAMLAHELRNPLAPLRNAVEILRIAPGNSAVADKIREMIERQVEKMSRLVNDLLDAARYTYGRVQLQLETLDLRVLAERAAELMGPEFEARKQEFTQTLPPSPVLVQADSTRLEQVLGNLLSNATKYTPEAGRIQLLLETVASSPERAPDTALIRVRDNGEGMTADLLPHVFDLFTQADRSLAHSRGGLGIGLNLVRTLVNLHGGTVSAHSEGAGRGSEFIVRLPLARRAQPRAQPDGVPEQPLASGSPSHSGQRVMVVDDNSDIAESSAMMLSLAGHEVRIARSGQQALDLAATFKPNTILLDIGMPDLNGYEIARRLRALPELGSVRLIAVSGYDTSEHQTRCSEAGFDHRMTKPVTLYSLQSLLGNASPSVAQSA